MKVITIVGARPQFIKTAIVSRVLRSVRGIKEILVHTGQHYDDKMSEVFFREMEIPQPDYNLGVGSNFHGAQTGRMIELIERLLIEEKPNWVLVYGDTNSTLAGALAAAKLHIPVAHVEAGLRSHNRKMPEEINRVLTDHISDTLFAPSKSAVDNLFTEGIKKKVYQVGDVMYDASLYYGEKAEKQSSIVVRHNIIPGSFILSTVHRAENTDNYKRLKNIFIGLIELSKEIPVIIPLHPRTRNALKDCGIYDEIKKNITVIDPIGYLDMIMLEKNALIIVTDSGGVQKEAFFFKVPCVTLRNETEWIELTDSKWNVLCSPDRHDIKNIIMGFIDCFREACPKYMNFYGSGNTANKIIDVISKQT